MNARIDEIKDIHLRGNWKDNNPYFKVRVDLRPIIEDRVLWKAVEAMEKKIVVFEKLRTAMRIAPQSGRHGLNDEGHKSNISTIEKRVKKFRACLVGSKDYAKNHDARKMIAQIDEYWRKLFADPIIAQTPSGPILIQPQRTNNILEQFFRALKRANRRRTGNVSTRRMLRTIIAETPLVRNLDNPAYMKIILNGKTSLDEVFAKIEIDTLRKALRKALKNPEKIPAEIKSLIAIQNFPEKVVTMLKKAVA